MSAEDFLRAGANAAKAVVAAIDGNPIDAARYAADAMLDLVPHETAAQFLTDAAVRRQNAIADQLERAKFGPPDHEED